MVKSLKSNNVAPIPTSMPATNTIIGTAATSTSMNLPIVDLTDATAVINTTPGLTSVHLPVAKIADLAKRTKDVVFEDPVLNRYGTFCGSKRDQIKYLNLRGDLLDEEGFATIMLVIDNEFIRLYEAFVQHQNYIRIENFIVLPRGNPMYDQGDAKFMIHINHNSKITTLPPKKNVSCFFPDSTIKNLLGINNVD